MGQAETCLFKNRLYEQFARLGKALSNPSRIEFLELLAQCERTVDSLAKETGLSLANASQHLIVLREAGLCRVARKGSQSTIGSPTTQ